MSNLIKIAVDAMGGDGSPKKLLMEFYTIINKIKKIFLRYLVKLMKYKNF